MSAAEQLRWAFNYIRTRYGTVHAAHEAPGWYGRGHWLARSITLARNDTGEPEPVNPGDEVP